MSRVFSKEKPTCMNVRNERTNTWPVSPTDSGRQNQEEVVEVSMRQPRRSNDNPGDEQPAAGGAAFEH